jgi:hypothetical protein
VAFLVLLVLQLAGCPLLISPYDQVAYQNATTLKAETLALVDKSTEPYAQHAKGVDALALDIDKAYEYAKGLPANQITAEQWAILKDPKGSLLGGFLETWRKEGKVSKTYATEKKAQLAQAFDYIICLEANKREATKCEQSKGK